MNIPLGFELGTGKPVNVPVRHTAVTGQTQESGKTTTLEAMILRSGLRAVCFATKPGEASFSTARVIMPYFREAADWQFVESILEATMREGMKFNRSWIMKLCQAHHGKDGLAPKGLAEHLTEGVPYFDALQDCRPTNPPAKKARRRLTPEKVKDFGWPKPRSLADVAANVEIALIRARGLHEGVYTELREYLRIVIPQIKALPKTDVVDLKPGINVMWLDTYSLEMQGLIIRSVLEWIMERETKTVTVIPEAWKLVPQGRRSPVMLACESLIRQGAANQNYIWLDSQDIAGVNKVILRSVAVWIMGVQREIHETERALDHMPGGIHKPKADDIRTLTKGQFYVTWGDELCKTYVWPAWMNQETAVMVALSGYAPPARPAGTKQSEDEMWRERAEEAQQKVKELEEELSTLRAKFETITADSITDTARIMNEMKQPPFRPAAAIEPPSGNSFDIRNWGGVLTPKVYLDYLWPELVKRLSNGDGKALHLNVTQPEIQVSVKREIVSLTDQTLQGKLAMLVCNGFFDETANGNQAFNELKRLGMKTAKPNVYQKLAKLAQMGFLTNEKDGYKRVPTLKITADVASNL